MLKRLARPALAGLLLFAALEACSGNPPYPRGELDTLFPEPPRPVEKTYTVGDRTIHYWEMAGGPARIVFIHGTPGDWKAWAGYLADPRLRAAATLIALDRPGFGASDPGRMAPAMAEQARLTEPLLRGAGAPALVVGHSLGGPIAAELALDYPDEVRGAVLVAPSIDPATEQPRWYNEAMTWRLVRWLAPAEFAWSNEEIMPLADELKRMDGRWKTLRVPVTVVQGMQDELVDPRTADYARRVLPAALGEVLVVPDQGHFVLWKRPALIVDQILATLARSAAKVVP